MINPAEIAAIPLAPEYAALLRRGGAARGEGEIASGMGTWIARCAATLQTTRESPFAVALTADPRTGVICGMPEMHPLARTLCRPRDGQTFSVGGVEYRLRGALGDGAVGLVRRAERVADGAEFAVKFLAPDPKYIEEEVFDDVAVRFRREGERGTKLSHRCLLKVHAYVANEGGAAFFKEVIRNPFLLMECIKGRTLEHLLRKAIDGGRIFQVTREKLHIAVSVCEALSYLHGMKLVHRDVKPANIFLAGPQSSTVKLGDFGIMKWGDFHASVSTGALTVTAQQGLGTMKYMSPEQAVRPKEVTSRSDIFSFGITLFELFTDQILLSPHHVFEVMNARLVRGTTASRFMEMGYRLDPRDNDVAELVLDMLLRGISGRPGIDKVLGRLRWASENYGESV